MALADLPQFSVQRLAAGDNLLYPLLGMVIVIPFADLKEHEIAFDSQCGFVLHVAGRIPYRIRKRMHQRLGRLLVDIHEKFNIVHVTPILVIRRALLPAPVRFHGYGGSGRTGSCTSNQRSLPSTARRRCAGSETPPDCRGSLGAYREIQPSF